MRTETLALTINTASCAAISELALGQNDDHAGVSLFVAKLPAYYQQQSAS